MLVHTESQMEVSQFHEKISARRHFRTDGNTVTEDGVFFLCDQ